MRRALNKLEQALDRCLSGTTSPWVYALLRIALSVLVLVRSSDVLRPWLDLEHHLWVHGLDFAWSVPQAPYLTSPVIAGFELGPTSTELLVAARTLLSLCLLLGIRERFSAGALALVSYALLLADRYRYFHHLHLLYLSLGWLAFCPLGDRLSLERTLYRVWQRRRAVVDRDLVPPPSSSAWPQMLLRALLAGVYLSAGLAKLDPTYWSGQTLAELDRIGMLSGFAWESFLSKFGYGSLAKLSCLTELGLPFLLGFQRTRWAGVALAVSLHVLIGSVLEVSTFGVTMMVLLLSYWPKSRPEESPAG